MRSRRSSPRLASSTKFWTWKGATRLKNFPTTIFRPSSSSIVAVRPGIGLDGPDEGMLLEPGEVALGDILELADERLVWRARRGLAVATGILTHKLLGYLDLSSWQVARSLLVRRELLLLGGRRLRDVPVGAREVEQAIGLLVVVLDLGRELLETRRAGLRIDVRGPDAPATTSPASRAPRRSCRSRT